MQAEQHNGDMLPSEVYNESRMHSLLSQDDIAEVHVFKATDKNLKMAELREKFPSKNRQQLRKILRRMEKTNGSK